MFPTAEQADKYGRQGGGPYAAGDGWVIVTETTTLAERIADDLAGPPGSSSLLTASAILRAALTLALALVSPATLQVCTAAQPRRWRFSSILLVGWQGMTHFPATSPSG